MYDCEDLLFEKKGRVDMKIEWLLGSIYLNCECVHREENVLKGMYAKQSCL